MLLSPSRIEELQLNRSSEEIVLIVYFEKLLCCSSVVQPESFENKYGVC